MKDRRLVGLKREGQPQQGDTPWQRTPAERQTGQSIRGIRRRLEAKRPLQRRLGVFLISCRQKRSSEQPERFLEEWGIAHEPTVLRGGQIELTPTLVLLREANLRHLPRCAPGDPEGETVEEVGRRVAAT